MIWRLNYRAVPVFFVVLFGLWTAAIYVPLLYSLLFPNHEIQRLIGALQGREDARQELSSYVQNTIHSAGHLKHAIRIAAYYGASAEYKMRQSHTSKETEYTYLAWFENRAKLTVFVINVSEVDASVLHFNMSEGDPLGLARILTLPLLGCSFCIYWFRRNRASDRNKIVTSTQIVGNGSKSLA